MGEALGGPLESPVRGGQCVWGAGGGWAGLSKHRPSARHQQDSAPPSDSTQRSARLAGPIHVGPGQETQPLGGHRGRHEGTWGQWLYSIF